MGDGGGRQAVGGTNDYNKNIGYVFAYIFPHSDAWPLFYKHTRDYLNRMSYLIGA